MLLVGAIPSYEQHRCIILKKRKFPSDHQRHIDVVDTPPWEESFGNLPWS